MTVTEIVAIAGGAVGSIAWATRMAFQIGKVVKGVEGINGTIKNHHGQLNNHEHRITVVETKVDDG